MDIKKIDSLPAVIIMVTVLSVIKAFFGIIALGFNGDFFWCLQVLNRMDHGQMIYRDIFLGVTPLSMYVLRALAASGPGAESICIVLVNMLSQIGTVVLCLLLARYFKFKHLFLLAAAIVYLTDVWLCPPYTPLAMMFLVFICLYMIQQLQDAPADNRRQCVRLFLLGSLTGLCFCSKQNIGMYVFAAVLTCYFYFHREETVASRSYRMIPVVLGFAAISSLFLAPIFFTGALKGFLDYCFIGKSNYLFSGISYVHSLFLCKSPHYLVILCLPMVCFSTSLWWWKVRPPDRNKIVTLFWFAVAATANAFPRGDIWHLNCAVPLLVTVFILSVSGILPAVNLVRLNVPVAILLIALSVFPQREGLYSFIRAETTVSKARYIKWLVVKKEMTGELERLRAEIPGGDRERTLFLFTNAAKAYLATDVMNPTPYDYPLSSAFGRTGEAEIMKRIKKGDIRYVILEDCDVPLRLTPWSLHNFVTRTMKQVSKHGRYRLFALK
ncbi:MAG: hypothetical protein WCG78_00130 [Candidatus Omnitrophota bacterium]